LYAVKYKSFGKGAHRKELNSYPDKRMKNKIDTFFKTVLVFIVSSLYSNNVFGVQLKYGVMPDEPIQDMYGMMPSAENIIVPWWTLERILAYIALPAAIITIVILGTSLYYKRRGIKKDGGENSKDGQA